MFGNSNFGFNGGSGSGGGSIGGGGTFNYICKFTPDGANIGNSKLFDNGVSVGIGTITPSASSILDITSTTQGFLAPRMNQTQRNAIASPAVGLFIFNTTSAHFNFWDGATWLVIESSTITSDTLSQVLAAGNTTGGLPIIMTSGDTLNFSVGLGGTLNSLSTTSARNWNLPDASGTIALTSNIPSVAISLNVIPKGTGTGIVDGNWQFSPNGHNFDIIPTITGANIGNPSNRIGTIFMASVFDYANNLTFFNGTSTTMTLTTGGNLGIGVAVPTSTLHVKGISSTSSDYALKVDNSSSSGLFYVRNDGVINTSFNSLKFGKDVGDYGTGSNNNSFGYFTLHDLTSGGSNNAFGSSAGGSTSTGFFNNYFGSFAGFGNSSGVSNNIIGHNSGVSNNGDYNLFIGESSGYSGTNSSSNTLLGAFSGYSNEGNSNVFIGFGAGYNRTNDSNSLIIHNANTGGSVLDLTNSLITGIFNTTVSSQYLRFNASVGIGLDATARLHVQGLDSVFSNFSLKIDNSSSTPLLYVANNGSVGIGNIASNTRLYVQGSTTVGEFVVKMTDGYGTNVMKADVGGSICFSQSNGANVNIGDSTISPIAVLEIQKSSLSNNQFLGFTNTQTGYRYFFGINATNNIFRLYDATATTDRLLLDTIGQFGLGVVPVSSRLQIQGLSSTSADYALKADNLSSTALLYVRNDGYTTIMDMVVGRGTGLLSGNTALGVNVLASVVAGGNFNTGVGYQALSSITTGQSNFGGGYYAGHNLTTGSGNVFIGDTVGLHTTTGSYHVALGTSTMQFNTNGISCIAIGLNALHVAPSNNFVISLGQASLMSLINGDGSIAIGAFALQSAVTATNNVGIGYQAGTLNTVGNGNIFLGSFSGGRQTTASNMLFIDNQDRGTAGADLTNAMIVGTFNPIVSNQYLRFNANVGIGVDALARLHNFGVSSTGINQRLEPITGVTEDVTGGTVSTTDATVNVTLQIISIPLNTSVIIKTVVKAIKTGGTGTGTVGQSCGFERIATYQNISGVVTISGIVQTSYTGLSIAGLDSTLIISGTNVLVAVTGVVDDNITWTCITRTY